MDGGKPLNINFSPLPTIIPFIRRKDRSLPKVAGTSGVVIADQVNSVVNVNWSAADVNLAPADYELLFQVNYASGLQSMSDPVAWTLEAT